MEIQLHWLVHEFAGEELGSLHAAALQLPKRGLDTCSVDGIVWWLKNAPETHTARSTKNM